MKKEYQSFKDLDPPPTEKQKAQKKRAMLTYLLECMKANGGLKDREVCAWAAGGPSARAPAGARGPQDASEAAPEAVGGGCQSGWGAVTVGCNGNGSGRLP